MKNEKTNKVVVYSAIFGNYDQVKNQPVHVRVFNEFNSLVDIEGHNRMKAKYYKCMPHEFLDCDYSIWIDGSATIHDPKFVKRCLEYLGKSEVMCFVHPEGRRCIYDEADYCEDMPKYRDQDIRGQVNAYRQEGYKENMGLWACGMVVRKHTKRVQIFNEMWWRENKDYTYQDQISFPYVAHKSGINLKTLWLNQRENDLITFNTPHANSL